MQCFALLIALFTIKMRLLTINMTFVSGNKNIIINYIDMCDASSENCVESSRGSLRNFAVTMFS